MKILQPQLKKLTFRRRTSEVTFMNKPLAVAVILHVLGALCDNLNLTVIQCKSIRPFYTTLVTQQSQNSNFMQMQCLSICNKIKL